REDLAVERLGLRQALVEGGLAELALLAVERVDAGARGRGAVAREAHLALVAAALLLVAAAPLGRARRQAHLVDALVVDLAALAGAEDGLADRAAGGGALVDHDGGA